MLQQSNSVFIHNIRQLGGKMRPFWNKVTNLLFKYLLLVLIRTSNVCNITTPPF